MLLRIACLFGISLVFMSLAQENTRMVDPACSIKSVVVAIGNMDKAKFDFSSLDGYIAEYQEILISAGIKVLDRAEMNLVMKERSLQLSGLTESAATEKTAGLMGADGVLVIKAYSVDSTTTCDCAKLVNIHTGSIAFNWVSCEGLDSFKARLLEFYSTCRQ